MSLVLQVLFFCLSAFGLLLLFKESEVKKIGKLTGESVMWKCAIESEQKLREEKKKKILENPSPPPPPATTQNANNDSNGIFVCTVYCIFLWMLGFNSLHVYH